MEDILKRVNKKSADFVSPDVEISVSSGGKELSAIAFYKADAGEWDVLVGVAHPSHRQHLASVLRWAADAVESAAFPLREATGSTGDSDQPSPLDKFPF